jgi:hypothetical protein
MLKHVYDWKEARELLLHLLPVSASLAGLSIASLSLFHFSGHSLNQTLGDDLLAFAALAFLVCCYLIFWALRTPEDRRALRLGRVVDSLFLGGMTCVVAAGFAIVYAIV